MLSFECHALEFSKSQIALFGLLRKDFFFKIPMQEDIVDTVKYQYVQYLVFYAIPSELLFFY